MGIIKVIFSLALIVFLALAATKIDARYIDYHSLRGGDHGFGCSKLHPIFCKKEEANPYTRGCEPGQHCRDDLGEKIYIMAAGYQSLEPSINCPAPKPPQKHHRKVCVCWNQRSSMCELLRTVTRSSMCELLGDS
ncbi:LOW QUALITY PROTEIN: hypothetical protein HID58_085787 [Brassica napus]|uniref:Uncharacterized protein n=1 Tax=Brassica napus TaxID=3708 RepID=A0ABQ7XNR7_BRANA|nr:LOW QUALITY PROTEIN: hypothetical protein HID58_085787 [Brassica napus]